MANYGPCCSCRRVRENGLHKLIALNRRAPVPWTGWGCRTCGLPNQGALAAVCDDCYDTKATIVDMVRGYAFSPDRIPITRVVEETFNHDLTQHPEIEDAAIRKMPDNLGLRLCHSSKDDL